MTYLESDDYIELNRIAVKNENEDYLGVQYPEGLDVLKQVVANYYDVELYPTVWEKWEKEHPNQSKEIDWGKPVGREIW